jgi:translation initiation factor IF-2
MLRRRIVTSKLVKTMHATPAQEKKTILEIVLKCDSMGSVEAVTTAISEMAVPEADIIFIRSGVGAVTKSDILLAETAGRLIVGFQVSVMPGIDKVLKEHRVEVRLYEVIYRLTSDIGAIAGNLTPAVSEERIIGSATVIALFKGSRKGIIMGCEVREGFLAAGHRFRIVSAMGPIYSGTIQSLHIGENETQKAIAGQQVGIKIKDFNKAKIGDLVETYRPIPPKKSLTWEPTGAIIKK